MCEVGPLNWFSSVKTNFSGVVCPKDKHIECDVFLKAARCFTEILNDQKHVVFIPVKNRFGNNVLQIERVYDELRGILGPGTRITLKDLVDYEEAIDNASFDQECATRGVLWFTRACQFLLHAFDCALADEEMLLSDAFKDAYANTLLLHHDQRVKPLFDAAMMFCPEREIFFRQMCRKDTMETTLSEARKYFDVMRGVKERLVQFCVHRGWDVRYGNYSLEDMKKCYLPKTVAGKAVGSAKKDSTSSKTKLEEAAQSSSKRAKTAH